MSKFTVVTNTISLLTSNHQSTLAQHSTVVLNTSVPKEACPYNLAPTASTTAALVMGDALGLVCAMQKGYSADKFADIHPSGNLGLRLMMVKQLMADAKQVPTVHANENIKSLISKMTHGSVRGAAAVVDAAGKLVGTVSDGDIRRFLEQDAVDLKAPVSMVMSNNPKTIRSTDLIEQALAKLEEFKIQFLFVVEDSGQFVGLVHVNSILGKKLY
jgi:arabinose-5-phosphate isomerase